MEFREVLILDLPTIVMILRKNIPIRNLDTIGFKVDAKVFLIDCFVILQQTQIYCTLDPFKKILYGMIK